MKEVLNRKASTQKLDDLHNTVAEVISTELKSQLGGEVDVKLLSVAIKFLKDNDITAEAIESNEVQSLAQSIKQIATGTNQFEEISVEDMIEIAKKAE